MEDGGVVLMDLLWSDPTTNDGVEGVQPSPRGPGLVTYGPDRVKDFCKVSQDKLILRSLGSLTASDPSPLQVHPSHASPFDSQALKGAAMVQV